MNQEETISDIQAPLKSIVKLTLTSLVVGFCLVSIRESVRDGSRNIIQSDHSNTEHMARKNSIA